MKRVVVGLVLVSSVGSTACGGAQVDVFASGDVTVHALRAPTWNAFVLEGAEGAVLFDTGSEKDLPLLRDGLEQAGFAQNALSAVVLSHAHFDHAGGARALADDGAGPLVVHEGDADLVRDGLSGPAPVVALEGHLVKPLLDETYAPAFPDVELRAGADLDGYGVRASLVPVPGHTPGSIACVLEGGDAFIGDLVRTDGDRAVTHLFSDDPAADRRNVGRLLDAGVQRFHVAHGPAVDAEAMRAWFEEQPLQAPSDRACGDHC